MFLSHRCTRAPSIGAEVATHAAVHERFRVHAVRNVGVVTEDLLALRAFERLGRVGRPVMTVVLDGRARIRRAGRDVWLERGDAVLLDDKNAIAMRQEGPIFRSVAIEWDLGSLGTRRPDGVGTMRISPSTLAAIEGIAIALATDESDADRAAIALSSGLEALASDGAPFDLVDPRALVVATSAATLRLARTLDSLLSDLRGRPMAIDLDAMLGLSQRQIQRVVRAFNERYGFNAGSWRDARGRRRVLVGAALMTARGATTESISEALGYGAPAAFCRALADVGLVSPGAVAREVANLG